MSEKWWHGYPWRLIQTNLREIDMVDIDADVYVRELQAFGASVVMINTAGIIASYKTELSCHFQSLYLTGDSLESIIAACHKADIKVIARMDLSKVRREIYEIHPEWAFRTCEGAIVEYNGDVHACINSDYQQGYALEIIKEVLTFLNVDGMYFNMGGFVQQDYSYRNYGICHCRACCEKFYSAYRCSLPQKSDMSCSVYRDYLLFQKDTLAKHEDLVRQTMESVRPGLCATRVGDEGFVRWEANTAIDRPLPRWQYEAANNTKIVVCTYGEKKISSNSCVDFIDFPARHMAVSPAQQKLRLYQSLAQGGALDYYIIGRLDNHADKSAFAGVKEVFALHKANEKIFNGLKPQSRVLIVQDDDGCCDEYRGWYRLLAENHFLFDAVEKSNIGAERLRKYKLIILPDCRYLSSELSHALDDFVADGGKLLSVYQSSIGDERFNQAGKPSLDCLGVEDIILSRDDMRGSYFSFDEDQLPSLPHTKMIYLDKSYLYARCVKDCIAHGALIPPQPFGPPERCYASSVTPHPCFVTQKYHKGTAVFLPWKPGAFYYRQGYTGYLAFARDLLQKYLCELPVGGDMPEMVEFALHQNIYENFHLLTIVNNSGHFGTSFFDTVPLMNRKVELVWESPVKRVSSLMRRVELDFQHKGERLIISVDELNMFDAIKIDG